MIQVKWETSAAEAGAEFAGDIFWVGWHSRNFDIEIAGNKTMES